MSKIGVNEKCPCGSNKKYKHCYLSEDKKCILHVREQNDSVIKNYEANVKEVTESLLLSTGELNQLFFKTDEDVEIIPSRMQLIGIFTIVDVLANYWYEYLGKTGTYTERFDDYINTFCFTNQNKEYLNKRYLENDVTSEQLRLFRGGLVHFYGLSSNHSYCIMGNPSKNMSQEQIDQMHKNIPKIRKDIKFIFIQPIELKKIVIEGAVLMLEKFGSDCQIALSEEEKISYATSIYRIQQKLRKEGASVISPEMADKVNEKLSNS